MLKIYYAKHTRALRVVWCAEELGVPYELKHTPFNPESLRSDEYLAVNPFAAVPAIEDGGAHMLESGAICQWLTEKHGKAPFSRVMGDADYPTYLQWTHAGEATLTPPLGNVAQHMMLRPPEKRISIVAEESIEKFKSHLAILDHALGGKEYLLGRDFTLPDIMVGYALHLASLFGLMNGAPTHAAAYWARLQARPGYQKAANS